MNNPLVDVLHTTLLVLILARSLFSFRYLEKIETKLNQIYKDKLEP